MKDNFDKICGDHIVLCTEKTLKDKLNKLVEQLDKANKQFANKNDKARLEVKVVKFAVNNDDVYVIGGMFLEVPSHIKKALRDMARVVGDESIENIVLAMVPGGMAVNIAGNAMNFCDLNKAFGERPQFKPWNIIPGNDDVVKVWLTDMSSEIHRLLLTVDKNGMDDLKAGMKITNDRHLMEFIREACRPDQSTMERVTTIYMNV